MPLRCLGIFDDMWFRWVSHLGLTDPGRAQGAKVLLLRVQQLWEGGRGLLVKMANAVQAPWPHGQARCAAPASIRPY